MESKLVVRVADKDSPSYIMGNDDGTITLYDHIVSSTGIESPVHLYSIVLLAKFENYMPTGVLELRSDLDYSKDILYEYKLHGGWAYEYNQRDFSNGNYSVYFIEKTTDVKRYPDSKIYKMDELKLDIERYNKMKSDGVDCKNMSSSQQKLLELINELNENNCIVVKTKNSMYFPALFRDGTRYLIYVDSMSQFHDYDDVTEIIDDFESYVNKEEEFHYDIILVEEFEKIRIEYLKEYIHSKIKTMKDDDNLKLIMDEITEDGGTYVITSSDDIKFLVGAVATDEDYYYVYLKAKGLEIEIEFDSCVGGYVPLHKYLPEKEYNRIKSYLIEDILSDGKIDTIENWIRNKILKTSEYILFTPIYLKNGKPIVIKQ